MGIGDEIRDEIASGLDEAFEKCRALNGRCACAEHGKFPCDAMNDGSTAEDELRRMEDERQAAEDEGWQ